MGKLVWVVMVSLATAGCSIVTSEKPLFDRADSAGAPAFRPGLWSMPDKECAFDPKSPAAGWPKCANGTVVGPKTFADTKGEGGKPKQTISYRLAAGDPLVLQLEAPKERGPDEPVFVYAGLRPVASDPAGRMLEARVWLALCAEPPPPEKALDPKPPVLPPGLTPGKVPQYCLATAKAAVRDAARRSEAWSFRGKATGMGLVARWVREAP